MVGGTLWVRVLAALVVAVVPPILLLAALLLLGDVVTALGPVASAIVIVLGALAWSAVLSVVFSRVLDEEVRGILALAERGARSDAATLAPAHEQLARVLDDRNHQITSLAARIADIPIDVDPRHVLTAVVSAVRSITGDATWRCAVLSSTDEDLLPTGSYAAREDDLTASPIADLEQWVSGAVDSAVQTVTGPWGAFLLIDISVADRLRAVMYAPWEGRPQPTAADVALLSLVGQHATIALQHAVLYHRVQRQADELNRLAAVQTDFLRGVTHDLQTPLTSIGTMAAEIAADESLSDISRRDLEMIVHQSDRLRRMVAQLLTASRLEAGAVHLAADVFAVAPLVERTWQALRTDRPFDLRTADPPYLAVGDADRVEQVMWAILDNAVKYSAPGSAIAVSVAGADGRLVVEVVDHGAGMDSDAMAHAFDQFYRSPQARALAPNGSGIGLYAARGLVRAMSGDIELVSSVGRGTTVRVTLPGERADEDE